MKKNYKAKLLGAIAALGLAVASTVGSTYAWFSMNTKVEVTGMQVKTKVSSNLLIAGDTLDSTAKKADSAFGTALAQQVKGYLEPVSTVDAENFFYTLSAKANGQKESGDYIAYDPALAASSNTFGNKFSEDYGVNKSTVNTFKGAEGPADAYVDYVFQLKAVATEANTYVNLTKVYLIDENAKDSSKAHRIAVFTQDITDANPTANDLGTLQAIFTESGAANQTSGEAVDAVDSTASVSYNTYANTTLATISTASTKYYKVVVRLWLEGEDTTCYNDMFLALSNSWSIELEMNLSTTNTEKATNISKIWTGQVNATSYWYDGTNVYSSLADAKAGTNGTAKASASAEVKTLFGIQ